MTTESVEEMLSRVGAVITGDHFVYKSGLHGTVYVNKDAVYPGVLDMKSIGGLMAQHAWPWHPNVVLGPVVGGAILAQWVSYGFSVQAYSQDVPSVYADKLGDDFIIKRGYDKLVAGSNLLVVEDIINTGKTVKQVIAAARTLGANIVGVVALYNRGDETAESLGVPHLYSLVSGRQDTYAPKDCPACQAGVPVNVEYGHGKEFLGRQATTAIDAGTQAPDDQLIDEGRCYGPHDSLPG